MDNFAPYQKRNTSFIVQNIITDSNKTVRIFQYPIPVGKQRDLLDIPGVAESDIRASLLKGEIMHKLLAKEIKIVFSDIDLLQFNLSQKLFLQQSGVVNGYEVGSGQITSELDNRISDGGGGVVGTYATAELSSQNASGLIRTTTPGKIFYCSTIAVSISNSSINNAGQLNILDGGDGGTLLLPITLASSNTQFTSQFSMALTFPTPLQFTTDTYAKIISGVLNYSITLVGYET